MPAVVIAAHARPAATKRLLASVAQAHVPADTSLVISIDMPMGDKRASGEQVRRIADDFVWSQGSKTVMVHDAIGLVEHFHRCGDLTAEHDSVVLLEDDLVVGRGFFQWAAAALEFGEPDRRIAGVGLATPWFDGYRRLRFEPVDDGSDAIYLQVPWYDGMAWTARMWGDYRQADIDVSTSLHQAFDGLVGDEWFPQYMRYLVQTGRTFLMPRSAHATGTGAAGAHFDEATDWFQSELAAAMRTPLRLVPIDESLSVYDDHMEPTVDMLRRLVSDLPDGSMIVDLRGTRDLADAAVDTLILTMRPVARSSRTWGAAMHPVEMNLAHDQPGQEIALGRVGDVDTSDVGERTTSERLRVHHARGQSLRRSDAVHALAPKLVSTVESLRDRIRRGR